LQRQASNDLDVGHDRLVLVGKLFSRFYADRGHAWSSLFKGDEQEGKRKVKLMQAEWAVKIDGFSEAHVWLAYRRLGGLAEFRKFVPSATQFRSLCVDVRRADDERKRFLVRRKQRLLPRPKPTAIALTDRRRKIAEALGRAFPLRKSNQGGG